jgi:hypothetical protein
MRERDLSMRICGFMLFNHKEKTEWQLLQRALC